MRITTRYENRACQETKPTDFHYHIKQKTTLRTAAALLLAVLTMLFATACGSAPQASTPAPSPKPQPKTEQIIYPAQFVHTFCRHGDVKTAKEVANDFKDSGGFTDAYAKKNGDVIVIATEKQRQDNIKENNQLIQKGEKSFQQNSPDYRYDISQDKTQMTIWIDKNFGPGAGSGIILLTPLYTGYNYYLEGHTGPWDMTITARNCHTDQLIHQYQFSQGWKFDAATFGD